jgi:hypothetical protein
MTSDEETYAFGDLDRRGKFFGLHLPQFILGWIVLFSAIPLLKASSWGGRFFWVAVMAALIYAAFGRIHDRGLWEWAPVLFARIFQLAMGETMLRGGPRSDRITDPNPILGGAAGLLRWRRLDDGRGSAVGVTYDPKAKTYSATLRVRAGSFSLLDSGTRAARVDAWGRLMASLTAPGSRLIRMAVTERTIPDSGDALQRHFDHALDTTDPTLPAGQQVAVGAYQQLLTRAAPAAQRHESFITLTMATRKAAKDIKRSGGGEDGALAVLFTELRAFEAATKRVGLISEGWLNPRERAALVRTQYDPASIDMLDQRGRGEFAARVAGRKVTMPKGVDPATAGPVTARATNDYYHTDSAYTRVFWLAGLPRIGMPAAFHSPMILESTCRRTMTFILEPVPNRAAEAQLNRRQLREGGDQTLREKFGKATTMRDEISANETDRKLSELLAGHGFMRLVALVAVSADDLDGLDEATGEISTLANLSRLELRPLYAQQAAAFAACCLPLGLGVGR